jgi:hypothetical protein
MARIYLLTEILHSIIPGIIKGHASLDRQIHKSSKADIFLPRWFGG